MAVLAIRAGKRYALRRPLLVAHPSGKQVKGLLIELSVDGCRISNLGSAHFGLGDRILAELDGIQLSGVIRWIGDGVAGIRMARPLYPSQLSQLVLGVHPAEELRRHAT